MARYGAGVSMSGINTADKAYFYLDNTSTAERLVVRQIIVNIGVAPSTAPALYLSRGTARGTQASTLAGIPLDPGETAATGTLDVCASGTPPTWTSSARIATGGLAVTAGGAWVWSFWDVPLVIPATTGYGIVVVNANASGSTTGTFHCSMLWDE